MPSLASDPRSRQLASPSEERHRVVAATRSPRKLEELRAMGAEAVVMDGLDPVSVGEVVGRAAPER